MKSELLWISIFHLSWNTFLINLYIYWYILYINYIFMSFLFCRAAEFGNMEALIKMAIAYLYNEGCKYRLWMPYSKTCFIRYSYYQTYWNFSMSWNNIYYNIIIVRIMLWVKEYAFFFSFSTRWFWGEKGYQQRDKGSGALLSDRVHDLIRAFHLALHPSTLVHQWSLL